MTRTVAAAAAAAAARGPARVTPAGAGDTVRRPGPERRGGRHESAAAGLVLAARRFGSGRHGPMSSEQRAESEGRRGGAHPAIGPNGRAAGGHRRGSPGVGRWQGTPRGVAAQRVGAPGAAGPARSIPRAMPGGERRERARDQAQRGAIRATRKSAAGGCVGAGLDPKKEEKEESPARRGARLPVA